VGLRGGRPSLISKGNAAAKDLLAEENRPLGKGKEGGVFKEKKSRDILKNTGANFQGEKCEGESSKSLWKEKTSAHLREDVGHSHRERPSRKKERRAKHQMAGKEPRSDPYWGRNSLTTLWVEKEWIIPTRKTTEGSEKRREVPRRG